MTIGKSLQGFAITLCNIANDFALPSFWNYCKNTSIIKESTVNAEFAFKFSNEGNGHQYQ